MVELGALLFTRVILGSVCLKNLRRTDWLLKGLKSEEPSYTKDKSARRALDGGLEKLHLLHLYLGFLFYPFINPAFIHIVYFPSDCIKAVSRDG